MSVGMYGQQASFDLFKFTVNANDDRRSLKDGHVRDQWPWPDEKTWPYWPWP